MTRPPAPAPVGVEEPVFDLDDLALAYRRGRADAIATLWKSCAAQQEAPHPHSMRGEAMNHAAHGEYWDSVNGWTPVRPFDLRSLLSEKDAS